MNERKGGYIQSRNIVITRHVLCQLHAAVQFVIIKCCIIVYESNYSAELLIFLLCTTPSNTPSVFLRLVKNFSQVHNSTPVDIASRTFNWLGYSERDVEGSVAANNRSSCPRENTSFRHQQLHKLGKTFDKQNKSAVQVTYGEMSFCCVNQVSGGALGFCADWLRSPTALWLAAPVEQT